MATTQVNGKTKTPAAVVAGKATPAKTSTGTAVFIPNIKAKAISKDVGPTFVKTLAKTEQDISQGEQLVASGKARKAQALSDLTLSIIKAVKIDPSIDLTPAVTPDADKKAVGRMLDQIRIVVGLAHVVTAEGTKGEQIQRLAWTPAVADMFPKAGEDKKSAEGVAKETLRSNVATQLKFAAATACGIVEQNMTASMDKQAGVLRIEGPAVKKTFGADSVLLNERTKQQTTNKKGEVVGETELKTTPSFSAIKRAAQVAHGASVSSGVTNDRTLKQMTPDKALQKLAQSCIDMLSKIKGDLSDETYKVCESLHSALDAKL